MTGITISAVEKGAVYVLHSCLHSTLAMLLAMMLASAPTHAGIWSHLSQQEQEMVQQRTVEELGKLVNQGETSEELQFIASNVGAWGTHMGKVVDGDFQDATQATMNFAGDKFLQSFAAEMKKKIGSLGSPSLDFVYEQVVSHQEVSLDIARLALRGEFSGAGEKAWETARTDVIAQLESETDKALDFAFNWVFNDAKVYGFSPAQIFREVIRVEKILIKDVDNYLRNSQQRQILSLYMDILRDNGNSHDAAWDMLGQSHITVKASSVQWLEEGTLRMALRQCADQQYGSLGSCIRDVQTRASEKLRREKIRAENMLKRIAAEQQAKTDAAYTEIQRIIQQAIAEQSQEYKDAISEAKAILGKIQTQARGIEGDCAAYDEKKALIDAARAKVKAGNIAGARLGKYIALSGECKTLAESPDDLATLVRQMGGQKGVFDQNIQTVSDTADLVCKDTATIAAAYSRAEGKTILDRAIQNQVVLNQAIDTTQASAQMIRETNTDIKESVAAVSAQIDALSTSIGNVGDVDALLQEVEAVKGARRGYDDTLGQLKAIVNRLQQRKTNLEQSNPVNLNIFEKIDEAIQGGIDKEGKNKASKLLARYQDFPKVQIILQSIKAANQKAECANYVIRSSGAANNFENLQWKSPNFDSKLVTKLDETKTECQAVPDPADLEKHAKAAATIAAEMEVQELPWIYKNKAERCIAAGLEAYNQLSDPAGALGGEVQQLEAVCGEAKASAGSAAQAAGSAMQVANSLSAADGLRQKAAAQTADINACGNLDAIRNRVVQFAADAANAQVAAQASAAHGTGIAVACASQAAVGAVGGDLNNIKVALRDAVVALSKAQEGDDQHGRIVTKATEVAGSLQEIGAELSQLIVFRSTVKDHIQTAERNRDTAKAGYDSCKTQQTALLSRAEALRGSIADEALAGLLARIQGVATQPGDNLAKVNQLLPLATDKLARFDDANAEVAALATRAKSECFGKPSPYADVLKTMQVILTIEGLSKALVQQRNKCLASLSATAGNGRGAYSGYDADRGNTDPARAGDGSAGFPGGSNATGNQAADGQEQQNAASAGTPIDSTYRDDPIADANREQERAASAERVAAAGNPRRSRPRYRRDGWDEYGDASDLDDLVPGGDKNRDRVEDDDRNSDGDKDESEKPPAPEPADPEQDEPKPGEPGPTEPEPDQPEPEPPAPKPEPPKPEPPVTPPVAPPPREDERCMQIVQNLMAQNTIFMANMNRFQAAAAAEDEAAASRLGCQLLVDTNKLLDGFNELSRAGCPIKGDTANLRSTIRQMRGQIETQLREDCGVSSTPSAAQFGGKWTSRGTCSAAGNAGFRWVVNLRQSGDEVSGTIDFHKCPGGGRASYSVSGRASSGQSITLRGSLTGGRGPLGSSASKSKTFTVMKNSAPSPNYAP